MRFFACVPALLLFGSVCVSTHAQIYKCKEANGATLYTDSPCDPDADTVAYMPKGTTRFQASPLWDPLAEDDPDTLAEQEQDLLQQLREARIEEGQSLHETTEVVALRRQLLGMLKSVRKQKSEVQNRGDALDEGEEIVPDR
ncbi:MAG: hypothetical protein V7606_217 [Burkholderiales bacterium]|jgi:hypothetical protein